MRFCVSVYLGVRLGLLLLGLLSTALLPSAAPADVPGWPASRPSEGWHSMFTAWERFDGLWFLRIASEGYRLDDGSAAFFPGYPLAVRSAGTVLGDNWLLAAYLVSNAFLLMALVLLYRLTELEWSERVARRTVLYLCVFPTGFFLFAPYSESMFLALSLGCLYAARRSSWLLAGCLGALASSTRSTGVLLALPLAAEAVLQARAIHGPLRPRLLRLAGALAASAAVGLGVGAYLVFWQLVGGDWRRPLQAQGTFWSKEGAWPWETAIAGAHEGVRYLGVYPGGYHTVDLVIVLTAVLAGVWLLLRVRVSYGLYFWASLAFPMTLAFSGRPFVSVPRYLLVVFPMFWALAALAERWRAHDLVVATSACGLGVLSVLFVNWYFIF